LGWEAAWGVRGLSSGVFDQGLERLKVESSVG